MASFRKARKPHVRYVAYALAGAAACVLMAVASVGGAADATADTTLLDAGVVESIAAVELLGRLREIDAEMGMWTAELLLGEGLRVRHLLVDEGDSD